MTDPYIDPYGEDREELFVCQECGTKIYEGDKYIACYGKVVGCYFCAQELTAVRSEPDPYEAADDAWARRFDG